MSDFEIPTTRLILRTSQAEADVENYASARQWIKEPEIPEDPEAGTLREVVWSVSSKVRLHYSVDDKTNCPFIYFTAPLANIGLGFIRQAQQNLDVHTYDLLLAEFDESRDPEDRTRALLRLALGSPLNLDDDSFNRITAALQDEDSRVR